MMLVVEVSIDAWEVDEAAISSCRRISPQYPGVTSQNSGAYLGGALDNAIAIEDATRILNSFSFAD